jgi:hypothetical protein
LAKNL